MIGDVQAAFSLATLGLLVSLGVSIFAAATALRALRLSRKTAQTQLRPYVYPSFIGLIFADDLKVEGLPENWATVAVHLKNFGNTPALNARATMTREIWEFPIPKKHKGITLQAFDPDRSDMPPGCTSENRMDFEITEAQRDLILDRKAAVYVMGRVEYSDAFGDPHHTNFFLYCTGEDFDTGSFRNCGVNNDAS